VRHKSIEIGPITALGITVLSLSNISRFYNAGFLLALFCLSSEALARQPAMANEQVPWNILFIVVDDEETHSKRLSRNGETLQCELTRRLAKDQFF
jgi:hypothetical protein